MNKITEFRMVTGERADQFTEAVNEALKEGWELHGFSFSMHNSQGFFFCQAMVKPALPANYTHKG